MKQSTKLLSLVLALVMAFSCISVIGNAALVSPHVTPGSIAYDAIDDADLTPEQVADIIMDLLDKMIADGDMSDLDLSILGKVRMDSLDHIIADFYSLYTSFWWTIGSGLLGDVGDLNLDNLSDTQRANGDLNFLYDALELLSVNRATLSKVAYGIGTSNGLSLGLIGSFISLGDIEDMLSDIPQLVEDMVFDMLIYGSYGYDKDAEELGTLPTEADTLDEMLNRAVGGLLASPQKYEWEGEGEDAVKVWDTTDRSKLMPTLAQKGVDGVISMFDLTSSENTIFAIIDKIAPYAIYDLGINALNNNLKKALMEAVEAEIEEIPASKLPEAVATAFEETAKDGEESYVNYIAYDKIAKSGNDWYYTTLESEPVLDATGNPQLDEEGNEKTQKVRNYFKVNLAAANKFADLINWDWTFTAPVPGTGDTTADALTELNYDAFIAEYGSITESLNHIIYIIYETALNDTVKAEFSDMTGAGWEDGSTTDCLIDNLTRVLKYLLAEHADSIFGSSSPYVDWVYSDDDDETVDVADMSLLQLIAHIGPTFFEDAMPQLILPKNDDGTVAFNENVQIYEFGAIVFREFMTEIAPNINYDSIIFADGDVTSAGDRHFAEHDADEWFNIILNMGMDIAATYLLQITNFSDYCDIAFGGGSKFDLEGWLISAAGTADESHWQVILDTAIMWAVNYVGTGSSSILAGMDPTKLSGITDPVEKLSYFLNTLLPLGFINGCSSDAYDFDASILLDKIKVFFADFDLTQLLSLFGRNQASKYNAFDDAGVMNAVLSLVNDILYLVFGSDLITETCLNDVLTQANLQTLIQDLFLALYTRRAAILENGLPVLAKFIQDWGGEQQMGTPEIGLPNTIVTTEGALTGASFDITNGSTGVWRHYKDAAGTEHIDQQYKYTITNISVTDFNGSGASPYVSGVTWSTTPIDFGSSIAVTYNVANVPTSGAIVRFVVSYTVSDEEGNTFVDNNGNTLTFETAKYAWLNYNPTDAKTYINNTSTLQDNGIYTPQYVGLSNAVETIKGLETGHLKRDYKWATSTQTGSLVYSGTQTVDGISWGNIDLSMPNGDLELKVRNFDSYSETRTYTTYNFIGVANGTANFTATVNGGGVDEAAWKAANKTPGSSTSFSVIIKDKDGSSDPTEFKIIYYDDIAFNDLNSLVNSENNAQRTAVEYYTHSNPVYADRVLVSADDPSTPDVNEKETNYSTTAWVIENADGTVTEVAEGTEDAKEVTKFASAIEVASTYMNALQAGIQGAYQEWNANSVYDHEARYEALRLATNDVQYIKKPATVIADEGGVSLDAAVLALKAELNDIEATYSDTKDYTDYKMYRWNRYNDARDDAKDIINAYEAAKYIVADTQYFPYVYMNATELKALVNGDAEYNHIVALLEDYTEEEMTARNAELAAAKEHYAGYSQLDVAQASNLIGRMSERLLSRDHGVITTYLEDEVASAENMIGTVNDDGNGNKIYTDRSWAKYIAAYNDAVDLLAGSPTQMTVFDTKYELLTCRNELVLVDDEADYSELEKLIAQAEMALKNTALYDNTDKEFGQVLAELGYTTFTNSDGDKVELFPGNAKYVNTEPYAIDDQDEIDDAATALKEALARLKFKTTTVTRVDNTDIKDEIVKEADENNIEAEILSNVTRIAQQLDAAAVKDLFKATATDSAYEVKLSIVSNDVNYSAMEDLEGFVGTNATVTFYTTIDDVNIPVATIKLVVDGDVNGDGVLDVLDASITQVVSTEHAELEGAYFLAGNLDSASKQIVTADYTAVVNKVIAA